MSYENYHKGQKYWKYIDIVSISHFLIELKDEYSMKCIFNNSKIIEHYRNNLFSTPLTLVFGDYKLEIQGVDEATTTLDELNYYLK